MRRRISRALFYVTVAAALSAAVYASVRVNHVVKSNDSQQVLIDKLAAVIDAANEKGADVPTPEQVAGQVSGADVSPPGPQGDRGDAGEVGATGETGASGPGPTAAEILAAVVAYCRSDNDPCRGSTGPQGADGQSIVGPKGDTGATGSAGADGGNGTNGVNGADGATGPQGPQGSQGPQGDPGLQGPQGATPTQMNCTQDEFFPNLYHCVVSG